MIEYELTPGDSLVQRFFEVWRAMIDDKRMEPATFTHNGTRIVMFPDDSENTVKQREVKEVQRTDYRVVIIPPGYKIKVTKERKPKVLNNKSHEAEAKE